MPVKLYVPLGDRIELMKSAAEFASVNQAKPIQLYHQMIEAVSTEPEPGEGER
ncbi:MAG: hypothetical protein ABSH41_09045 [Syntrophobacteraceae bacterium]|jgi:hypothetical protein